MPATLSVNDNFDFDLTHILPRLRIYAMSLTRNPERADELVQQTALKALTGRKSFRHGTNFAGWVFRIQRNEFISELRRTHLTVSIDDSAAHIPVEQPKQETGLMMRDFIAAFRKLSQGSRQTLLLSKLEGYSHKQIARHAGISEGTVKSRMWRGRAALDRLLAPA